MQTTHSSNAAQAPTVGHRPDAAKVMRAITRRSFATLASASSAGRPHVAGVLYERVGSELFISTLLTSRKARNVAAGGRVGVSIPIRRLPVGPPSTVQFQAKADLLDVDDPVITGLVDDGHLGSITGHGELELSDGCFIRVAIPHRLPTYGLGMSLWKLIRDPLGAGGIVELGPSS